MGEETRSDRAAGPDRRHRLGSLAEDLCARDLEGRGWRILARNWRIRMGELDIVAIDGTSLVIVEVKALREGNVSGPATPVLAVGPGKQRRLRLLAEAWLEGGSRRHSFAEIRFDVVGITIDTADNVVSWQHVEDAF